MAFKIDIHYRTSLPSKKDADRTISYLKNYGDSIPLNFPGIESFTETEPKTYQWKFEKLSHSGKELQIAFATRFDETPDRIKCVPVKGSDQASLQAEWTVVPKGLGAEVKFEAKLGIEIPLPGLLRAMIAPMAEMELKKLFDEYAANLQKALE